MRISVGAPMRDIGAETRGSSRTGPAEGDGSRIGYPIVS